MNKKILMVAGSALLLIGVFAGLAMHYKKDQKQKMGFMAKENAETFVRPYSPRLGNEDAEVFLVEFLDPECESCRDFHPRVKELLLEFEGKVTLVVRYAPFHENSIMAVKILEAARKQDKFWETLDVLFRHQDEWGGHHNPRPERVWTFLSEAGLDTERIRKEMEDPTVMANLQQDVNDGEKLGVYGTPTFFINGNPLEQFGYGPLKEAIKKALE